MSREVRRVPLNFDWPLNEVWEGYVFPSELHLPACPDCDNGWSERGQYLLDMWYGKVPFDPKSAGSTAYTTDTAEVRAFAERNVSSAPEFYGTGEWAIQREARRLADLFNTMWMHHLSQEDVDALVDGNRLWDFTRTWDRENGWQDIDPPVRPTAEQVNRWSLTGMGHDSSNACIVVRARCAREGASEECSSCNGSAVSATVEKREAHDAWEPTDPPAGEGWQLWETVSEGSPISPVFETRTDFVEYLVAEHGMSWLGAEAFVDEGCSVGSFVMIDGEMVDGMDAVKRLEEQS